MIGFFIAVLSGILMSVQGVWNSQVTKQTGIWVSNGWVQLTALLTCLAAWFMSGREDPSALLEVEPRYVLLGGVIGAGITWTVIKSIEKMGPAKSVLFIVVAQLLSAYLIELFGLFGTERQPFDIRKMAGIGIAMIGVAIFQWK